MHNALLCPARKPAFCGKMCIPLSALHLKGQLQIPLPSAHCVRSHLPQGDGFSRRRQSFRQCPKASPWGSWQNRQVLTEGVFPAAPPLPQEAGAANAVCLYAPRENEIAERPQTLRYLEIKIIFPLIMPKAHAAGIPNRPLLLRHGLQHRLLQVGDRDGAQRLQVGIRAVCREFADLHGIFAFQVAAPACAVLVPLLA